MSTFQHFTLISFLSLNEKWTGHTFIPVFTNALGGIVVGLVTKYAGSVRKGFALIFGMVLTGTVQSIIEGVPLSSAQMVGGILAALSLWMHVTNPHIPSTLQEGNLTIENRQKQE